MSFVIARKNAGLSQRDAAAELKVSDAAVCMWETGKTLPRSGLLPKIAKLYGCSIDELLIDNNDNHIATREPDENEERPA